ncbi:DUF5916 domain-containing protein [Roseisolibacter sp. H3M3-2]|uniref:DUF5916 domain-containing protein n=1 Tax=Roseisolibacter sp. H3M3-2 TaxID=3031323 RepID=UPI0023DB44C4|nr:DUF5916 domain-containing protein [Roseisolibacter sp. H3M3-2]MDF1504679.1 DUF5916 domain-containing protein [Roseisolibacter sp. H3M3-2]
MSSLRGSLPLLLALLLALLPAALTAQTVAGPGSQNDPRPTGRPAVRQGPIAVDGRLDEAAWAAAPAIGGFRQQQPDQGAPPSQRTELRVLFDATTLYVGARMFDDAGAAGVRAILARRDQLLDGNASDKIALVFDPFRDRNTRIWFELNPLGVRGDHFNGDASFDPVWEGAAHVDSLGWTAEFRIPLSQLRFARDSAQVWGMQAWRTITRRNEQDMWAYWRPDEAGGPAYFGTLEGFSLTQAPRQVELLPYAVSSNRYAPVAPGDPFHSRGELKARVGADVKVNLTSNLTLDATINPDFGQVEVDPARVNLSAFEQFFQERRPFFVANANAFSFGNFNCYFCSNVSNLGVFYSRRIGRPPQLAGMVRGGADHVDAPDASTILGAAKLTGRTSNGWQVGILDALTQAATARYVPAGAAPGGPYPSQEIEPLTNYFMGRLRKDFRGGDTRVGGITTLTNRRLTTGAERERLRSDAQVLGLDVQHYWQQRRYSFVAQVAGSRVGGDTSAIRRTQETSAHFFQRPDRAVTSDGLFGAAYDPTRRSLGGYGLYARVAKETGGWLWETAQNWRSPGFEVNDMAFLDRADYRWMNANVVRQWTVPGPWYRSVWTSLGGQQQYNFDGDRTDRQGQVYGQVTFRNWMQVSGFVIHRPASLDDRMTRGGPVVKRAGYTDFSLNVSTDSRKAVTFEVGGEAAPLVGTEGSFLSTNASLAYRPSPRLLLRMGPSWNRTLEQQQYVAAVADPTATAFGGTRYVFGAIDQRTLSLDTRFNATFTPDLTLELFAQPFLASGDYRGFNEYVAPRGIAMRRFGRDAGTVTPVRGDEATTPSAYRIDPDGAGPAQAFTLDNPNFNLRSLRGTAVVRWEYRPGSTLFFVWTQQREGSDAHGDFRLGRDRAALFRDRATNIFQLKATYWIGR